MVENMEVVEDGVNVIDDVGMVVFDGLVVYYEM